MEVYHEGATSAALFNPYLPAIGRVLHILRSYGPAGTTIQICNRDLARAALCSAGAIPAILKRLEVDGMIERVTSHQGSLISVVDQTPDRIPTRSEGDQESDRANRTETPDRRSM